MADRFDARCVKCGDLLSGALAYSIHHVCPRINKSISNGCDAEGEKYKESRKFFRWQGIVYFKTYRNPLLLMGLYYVEARGTPTDFRTQYSMVLREESLEEVYRQLQVSTQLLYL